jgi:signal transduction histidine kinase
MSTAPSEKSPGKPTANAAAVAVDLQENLRRLDRLANLGIVSAGVAHEIKNGLTAINTFVEILLEKGEDKEMAEVVRRELKRIDQLVTQMLRFSSPKPAARTWIHAHKVLDHSLRLLEHQMTGRLIVLKRDYQATFDKVHGDESQLQQAFMNLLMNGVEAIGNDGELTVFTENGTDTHGRHQLKIHIRDTGPGIPAEHLTRVFEPFFTTKKNGTGLGLAICQRIAQEHSGQVDVQSEAGRGSNFIISLAAE